jgi:hypothetical protein
MINFTFRLDIGRAETWPPTIFVAAHRSVHGPNCVKKASYQHRAQNFAVIRSAERNFS